MNENTVPIEELEDEAGGTILPVVNEDGDAVLGRSVFDDDPPR